MDIAEEVRVWGARQSDHDYWGESAYRGFAQKVQWRELTVLNGQDIRVLSETETHEDYDGSIQMVFAIGDQVFAMDGTYSSWNGTEWYGEPYEVDEQPVTKIEYVRKR